jgi:two-component system, OmpR family, KDP operon response regulator KdpE
LSRQGVGDDGVLAEHQRHLRSQRAHLRRKLKADPAHPRYLLTEAGVGYRLAAE